MERKQNDLTLAAERSKDVEELKKNPNDKILKTAYIWSVLRLLLMHMHRLKFEISLLLSNHSKINVQNSARHINLEWTNKEPIVFPTPARQLLQFQMVIFYVTVVTWPEIP